MTNEIIENAIGQATRMLEAGEPVRKILEALATAGEQLACPDEVCSILVLDEEGLLRNGGSPHLPGDYLAAIDKLKPNAKIGTCAAAAATGQMVITPDFRADGKWTELRHLPLAIGYVGAWSMPIKQEDGKVLGTFGTYFKKTRMPSAQEMNGIRVLSEFAARVLAGADVSLIVE